MQHSLEKALENKFEAFKAIIFDNMRDHFTTMKEELEEEIDEEMLQFEKRITAIEERLDELDEEFPVDRTIIIFLCFCHMHVYTIVSSSWLVQCNTNTLLVVTGQRIVYY